MQTFKKRALEIADKAQNTRTVQQGGDSGDFMGGLDETERQCTCQSYTAIPKYSHIANTNLQTVFRAAHDGSNNVKKWFESSSRS